MINNALYSSGKNDWETPRWLFDKLNSEHAFTMDPCCTHENAKCDKHFTIAEDGLSQDWQGETVFVNPPYSAKEQDLWVRKCYEESQNPNTKVVALLPARTDTKRFHKYIKDKAFIYFLEGRLTFEGAKSTAPFPSMIVVWAGKQEEL